MASTLRLGNPTPSFFLRLLAIALWMVVAAVQAQTKNESRLALLIGNAAYKNSPLFNPVNDVRLMETALKDAGFTIIKAENATIREMRRLIRDFGDRLKTSGGVGLFYFAGHGVQVRGDNYLVSTDSDIRNEDEIADDSVNANVVLEKMQTAGNRMNIIILDACRNNPFAVKSRSAAPGLATMNAPSGSIVAYSTAPGSVASDGTGKNGLYTEHLARAIVRPGLPVEEVFKQVRAAVRRDSGNQQTPWENTALEGQFFFKNPLPAPVQVAAPAPAAVAAPVPLAPQAAPAPDPSTIDLAFWESIKSSQRPAEYQAYLSQFPNGIFAGLARARIEEDRSATVAAFPPAPQSTVATALPTAQTAPTATSARPPAQASVPEGAYATLVVTEPLTGIKKNFDVSVQQGQDGRIIYSTGDVIDKDGKVLQARIGDVVVRQVSGSLWTTPPKAGTSGEAVIMRADQQGPGTGSLAWKSVAMENGKTRIEASISYLIDSGVQKFSSCTASGRWLATFSAARPLPDSFSTSVRGCAGMYTNNDTAELRYR